MRVDAMITRYRERVGAIGVEEAHNGNLVLLSDYEYLQDTNRILQDTVNLANATNRAALKELTQAGEDLGTLIQAVKDFGLSNCADDLIAVVKRFEVRS